MLGLAAPIWLAALAALTIPIALHLWTRRPGRLVRIGSIRHLGASAPAARRLRLDEPWLLLLRASVLIALVLALAEPYLATKPVPVPEKWALVELGSAADAVVDSLRGTGAAVRLLIPGLPLLRHDSIVAAHPVSASPAPDVWSLLREADHIAPPGTRLAVVAVPRLTAAAGERPRIRSPVEWIAPPGEPELVAIEARRAATPDGDISSAYILFDSSRGNDARYLAAALRAMPTGSLEAVHLLPTDSGAAAARSAGRGDWMAWLADAPPPAELSGAAEAGAIVLTDSHERREPSARILVADRVAPFTVRLAALPDSSAPRSHLQPVPLWEDAAGRPLVTAWRSGEGIRLELAGRFGRGSLVLDPAFPELIARLWHPEALEPAVLPVTVTQVLPRISDAPGTSAPRPQEEPVRTDGTLLLWLLTALLLLGERVFTAQRAARRSGG